MLERPYSWVSFPRKVTSNSPTVGSAQSSSSASQKTLSPFLISSRPKNTISRILLSLLGAGFSDKTPCGKNVGRNVSAIGELPAVLLHPAEKILTGTHQKSAAETLVRSMKSISSSPRLRI